MRSGEHPSHIAAKLLGRPTLDFVVEVYRQRPRTIRDYLAHDNTWANHTVIHVTIVNVLGCTYAQAFDHLIRLEAEWGAKQR